MPVTDPGLNRLGSCLRIGLYKALFCLLLLEAGVDGGLAQERDGEASEPIAAVAHPELQRGVRPASTPRITHRYYPAGTRARADRSVRADFSVAARFSRFNGLRPPSVV